MSEKALASRGDLLVIIDAIQTTTIKKIMRGRGHAYRMLRRLDCSLVTQIFGPASLTPELHDARSTVLDCDLDGEWMKMKHDSKPSR